SGHRRLIQSHGLRRHGIPTETCSGSGTLADHRGAGAALAQMAQRRERTGCTGQTVQPIRIHHPSWADRHILSRRTVMAVLTAELIDTWSKRGDPSLAFHTYLTVKDVMSREQFDGMPLDTYPQGSYANKTNIAGDSDVDLVMALQSAFYPD